MDRVNISCLLWYVKQNSWASMWYIYYTECREHKKIILGDMVSHLVHVQVTAHKNQIVFEISVKKNG